MAIGSLFVELGVNTAAFSAGLDKATYAAKAATQQIGSSLRGIGGVLSELGGEFGAFGNIAGAAIGSAGSAIREFGGELSKVFGSSGVGKGLTYASVGILGVGAAAATAAGAVIGIAIHASEAAARIHELSQITGVSVQQLSGLSIVAKVVGVDTDTLAKGLERMDKSALMAAQGFGAAAGGWKTLGISVTDSQGKLKSTTDLFTELSTKFSGMEDGALKTGLAMQLLGKAGANLIPVLNQGPEAIKYWIDYGTRVGAVLTGPAAEGAHNFQQELDKLGLISTGVQNQVMNALLPALDHIVQAFSAFAQHGDTIKNFGVTVGNVLVGITKIVFEAAYAWEWWGNKLDIWKAKFDKAKLTLESKITGVKIDTTPEDEYIKDREKKIQSANDRLAVELADLSFKGVTPAAPEGKHPHEGAAPAVKGGETAHPVEDYAGKLIGNATAARDAELALADAIGKGTGALILQAAASDADRKLTDTLLQVQGKLKQLGEEAAAAHAAGNANKEASDKAAIANLHAQQLELVGIKDKLEDIAKVTALTKFTVEMAKGFETANDKLKETIAGMNALAAAANKGGQALLNAQIESKLADDKAKVDAATAAYNELNSAANKDQGQLDLLARALAAANAQLDEHRKLLADEQEKAFAVRAAHSNLAAQLATENTEFAKLSANAADADTKLVLLAQHQANLNKITSEWDNAALAVGTFGQKVKAVMDQLDIESQQSGKKMAEAFKTAIDGVAQNFADLVVKGKANWAQLFDSLESAIVKQLASQALNQLIKKLSTLGNSDSSGDNSGDNSGGGGFFSSLIGGLFGGGKASGGPVAPGVSYLVGEQGPETFVPGTAGTIIPNPGSSSPQVNANFTMNIHGATDPDTFRKAAPQVQAQIYRSLQIAAARAGQDS